MGALLDKGSSRDEVLKALGEVRESLMVEKRRDGCSSVPERVADLVVATARAGSHVDLKGE